MKTKINYTLLILVFVITGCFGDSKSSNAPGPIANCQSDPSLCEDQSTNSIPVLSIETNFEVMKTTL